MDKVKVILAGLRKHYFWALCGTVLVVALAGWGVASVKLANRYQQRADTIDGHFAATNGIIKAVDPPNDKAIEATRDAQKVLKGRVLHAWQDLYKVQKDNNPWPAVLSEDFRVMIENRKPDRPIQVKYLDEYLYFITDQIPRLLNTMEWRHVERIEQPPEEEAETTEGNQMQPGTEQYEWVGKVVWEGADQTLQGRFRWDSRPSTAKVLFAQEDLWVYDALLRIIRNTNEGATSHYNAAVKEILVLQIGRDMFGSLGSGGGGPGMPDMQPGATGGPMAGGPGDPGGGFDDQPIGEFDFVGMPGGMGPRRSSPIEDLGGGRMGVWVPSEEESGVPMRMGPIAPGAAGTGDVLAIPAGGAAQAPAGAGGVPPPPPTMGGPFAGPGRPSEEEELQQGRYVNKEGKHLWAGDKHPYAEFKMMPIRMRLMIDQGKIPKLLVECANSSMPVVVQAVRLRPGEGTKVDFGGSTMGPGAGGPAAMDSGRGLAGPRFGASARMAAGAGATPGMGPGSARVPPGGGTVGGDVGGDVGMGPEGGMLGGSGDDEGYGQSYMPVEIKGVICIYNPPDIDKLATGTAAEVAPVPTTPPVAVPTTPPVAAPTTPPVAAPTTPPAGTPPVTP